MSLANVLLLAALVVLAVGGSFGVYHFHFRQEREHVKVFLEDCWAHQPVSLTPSHRRQTDFLGLCLGVPKRVYKGPSRRNFRELPIENILRIFRGLGHVGHVSLHFGTVYSWRQRSDIYLLWLEFRYRGIGWVIWQKDGSMALDRAQWFHFRRRTHEESFVDFGEAQLQLWPGDKVLRLPTPGGFIRGAAYMG